MLPSIIFTPSGECNNGGEVFMIIITKSLYNYYNKILMIGYEKMQQSLYNYY